MIIVHRKKKVKTSFFPHFGYRRLNVRIYDSARMSASVCYSDGQQRPKRGRLSALLFTIVIQETVKTVNRMRPNISYSYTKTTGDYRLGFTD